MSRPPVVMQLCLTLDTGGLERIVVSLANYLSGSTAVSPQICTVGRTEGKLLPRTVNCAVDWYELSGPTRCNFATVMKLIFQVRRRKVKLIHAHGTQPLVYALLASLATGVPIAFTKHNSYEDLSFFTRRRFFNLLACRRVTRFVGVSEQATEILKRVFSSAADRCVTQINGTELPSEEIRRTAAFTRKNNTGNQPFVILTVCRLAPEKDLTTLLQAFALVQASEPNTELWIVGDGNERGALTALAKQLRIERSVRFWGFRGKIQQIMACSDLFVNSSITEGVSLSILEAMSLGLPVVATRVGGTPTVVRDGETGLLTEPRNPRRLADAILRLCVDRHLCQSMGDRGSQEINLRWSLARMADRYLQIYSEGLGIVQDEPVATG